MISKRAKFGVEIFLRSWIKTLNSDDGIKRSFSVFPLFLSSHLK